MAFPQVKLGYAGNIFVRQMFFASKGDAKETHVHQFDHMTLLAKGSVEVTVEGKTHTFVAPQMIWIAKDKDHQLVALEDGTLAFCVHAIRDEDGVPESLDVTSLTS